MQRVKFRAEWIATVVTEPAVYRAVQLARLSRCPQDCTESPESPQNGRGGGVKALTKTGGVPQRKPQGLQCGR